jgi:hypothetical protein
MLSLSANGESSSVHGAAADVVELDRTHWDAPQAVRSVTVEAAFAAARGRLAPASASTPNETAHNDDAASGWWPARTVFRRTRAGDDEVVFRERGLRGDLWDLLLRLDGRRDLSAIRNLLPAFARTPGLLVYLIDIGFVKDIDAQVRPSTTAALAHRSSTPARATTVVQPRTSGSGRVDGSENAHHDAADTRAAFKWSEPDALASFRAELHAHIAALLGGYAEPVLRRIGSLRNRTEAQALLRAIRDMVDMQFGARAGAKLVEKFGGWFETAQGG